MPFSDEDLIAYLLGDANLQQRQRIEAGLVEDEDLRARLSELRMVLGQLNSMQRTYEPPADLLATTMARIDEVSKQADDSQFAKEPVRVASSLSAVSEVRLRRTTWDSTALIACLAVLFCMFIPTVLRARFESRRAQCAYRLSYMGRGLIDRALTDPQQRFQAVALQGPAAFAGIYAIGLGEAGLVNSPAQLRCASLEGCRPKRETLEFMPTMAQLKTYDTPMLELCRVEVGGDYAYCLGVVDQGMIVPPRCEGKSNFAVLADAPLMQEGRQVFAAHDGRGMNIFFEDGHVAFVVSECWQDQIGDNPFCNNLQAREAGLTKYDASLGPSHFRPLDND